jgi:Uncharacterized protein conserved in bacteria (DUF2252)
VGALVTCREKCSNPRCIDLRNGMVTDMDQSLVLSRHVDPTGTPDERRGAALDLRRQLPRSALAEWTPQADRTDPVAILIDQGKSRIQDLLPVRYFRMQADPFAFFRGAAAIMAADLASMPSTGIRLQACGDAHFANFGSYATPEGTPIFDLNDFDETLPARHHDRWQFRTNCLGCRRGRG